jgi:hypothetical protein
VRSVASNRVVVVWVDRNLHGRKHLASAFSQRKRLTQTKTFEKQSSRCSGYQAGRALFKPGRVSRSLAAQADSIGHIAGRRKRHLKNGISRMAITLPAIRLYALVAVCTAALVITAAASPVVQQQWRAPQPISVPAGKAWQAPSMRVVTAAAATPCSNSSMATSGCDSANTATPSGAWKAPRAAASAGVRRLLLSSSVPSV